MKAVFVILCVIGQVAVLAFMAGQREYVLINGETVYLRTVPVDPRNVFMGDYVQLTYEAASIRSDKWRGAASLAEVKPKSTVYAALALGPGGLAEVAALSDRAPEAGPYLKGRLDWTSVDKNGDGWLQASYGVEQYFVEQGKGREIERQRGGRNDVQVPMEVELKLGFGGTGVIAGYRWSRIGIGLEVLRQPRRRQSDGKFEPGEPQSPKLKLTLANVSEAAFALYNPGEDCGFELVPADRSQPEYVMAYQGCEGVQAGLDDVFLLQPGESHAFEFDLSLPRWHVRLDQATGEIGKLAQWQRFRLVYRTPPADKLTAVPSADRLWLGRLPSRAFNASGYVD